MGHHSDFVYIFSIAWIPPHVARRQVENDKARAGLVNKTITEMKGRNVPIGTDTQERLQQLRAPKNAAAPAAVPKAAPAVDLGA